MIFIGYSLPEDDQSVIYRTRGKTPGKAELHASRQLRRPAETLGSWEPNQPMLHLPARTFAPRTIYLLKRLIGEHCPIIVVEWDPPEQVTARGGKPSPVLRRYRWLFGRHRVRWQPEGLTTWLDGQPVL